MIRWILAGLACAAALAWLIRAFLHLRRWHRANRPHPGFYLSSLVLPLVVVTIPMILLGAKVISTTPVPSQPLQTAAGRIEEVAIGSKTISRYGPRIPYLQAICLEDGYSYRLPGKGADPEQFLIRAGREPVTLTWVPTPDGGRQICDLTTADGTALCTYAQSSAYLSNILTLALVLLGIVWVGAVGGVCTIPRRFYRPSGWDSPIPGRGRGAAIAALCIYVLASAVLLLGMGVKTSLIPAYTQVPLSLELAIQLPGRWEEKDDGEYTWYSTRDDVSLCIFCYDLGYPEELGMSREDWVRDYFSSIRLFLLDTFVDDSGMGSFLTQRTDATLPGGLEAVCANGQARSQGGSLNYFATAALPEQGCAVMIQASSWDMDWEELAYYGENTVQPLLRCLVVSD